jgi:hypothetical protein
MTSVLLAAPVAAGILLFSSKSWGDKLAGIAAGIAVLYAGYQIRLTRAVARQTLGYQYFERFSRYSLDTPYATAKAFSFPRPKTEAEEQQRWDQFKRWQKEDPPTRSRDVLFIFNFFEELGGVYKHGAVDRRVVNEYLGKFALNFWSELPWFVRRLREDQEAATLFEDWEAMSRAVKRAGARRDRLRNGSRPDHRACTDAHRQGP